MKKDYFSLKKNKKKKKNMSTESNQTSSKNKLRIDWYFQYILVDWVKFKHAVHLNFIKAHTALGLIFLLRKFY